MKLTVGVLVFLLGAGPVGVSSLEAQSLAEIAKKEKQRRKKVKPSGKTITNDDLGRSSRSSAPPAQAGQSSTSPSSGEAAAAKGEEEEAEKTSAEVRAEKTAQLQAEMDTEVDRMQQIQKQMDEAQAELNDFSTMTYGSRRANLMKLLEDGKAEIAKSEEKIAEIEEQARRAGVRVSRGQ